MALADTGTELSCVFCDTHDVYFFRAPDRQLTKNELFHAACDACDYPDDSNHIMLCEQCRHLRLDHILWCIPERNPEFKDLTVKIYPMRVDPERCKFCFFVASLNPGLYQADEDQQDFEVDLDFIPKLGYLTLRPPWSRFQAATSGNNLVKLQPFLNWDWLNVWMQSWIADVEFPEHLESLQSLRQPLHNVRVVDVANHCLTHLPTSCQYAALSYVWGANSTGQFQALRSNVQELGVVKSLLSVGLPLTILDAMIACERLGLRYLWVDRLCITQDGDLDEKWEQLNQMASIYHQAKVTLVAAAGEDPTYGLPGISRERTWIQREFQLNNKLVVQEHAPSLQKCLEKTVWWERGWTYQEWIASSTLLYFTDYGLYIQTGDDDAGEVINGVDSLLTPIDNFDMLGTYSGRMLTHPTDILPAISGILYALYGHETLFGMPLDDFDVAILWISEGEYAGRRKRTASNIFPSWSWISGVQAVDFTLCVAATSGLAYWRRPSEGGWVAIGPPTRSGYRIYPEHYEPLDEKTRTVAALAWCNGCINAPILEYLVPDCSREMYEARLRDEWPDVQSFWQVAFGTLPTRTLFDETDVGINNHSGHLQVYAQKAVFYGTTVPPKEDERRLAIVRNNHNQIAGMVLIEGDEFQQPSSFTETELVFLALSVVVDPRWERHIEEVLLQPLTFWGNISTSELYGCPCASVVNQPTVINHFRECPKHAEFACSKYYEPSATYYSQQPDSEHIAAFSKHMEDLSFFDVNHDLLHRWDAVPMLNVMLVSPEWDQSLKRNVYKRIGMGEIYLKRWIEASPVFDTIVLA
jgi:hypothetical protein